LDPEIFVPVFDSMANNHIKGRKIYVTIMHRQNCTYPMHKKKSGF